MPPNKEPTEADIIFNKASVALAKSQRLIASWLPPRSAEELKKAKSEEELENEEKAMFAPVPEVLGIGAPLPNPLSDSPLNRRRPVSDDKLLQQLLGKKAAKERAKGLKPALQPQAATQRSSTQHMDQNDSEEENTGRSSMFSSRKKRQHQKGESSAKLSDTEESDGSSEGKIVWNKSPNHTSTRKVSLPGAASGTKRPSSFLDDLLASRHNKKKKSNR